MLSFHAHDARGGDQWEPYLPEMRSGLIHLARQLHVMALAEIHMGEETLPQLSPCEIECLRWTARGKTHTEIAVILNL